MSILEIYEGKKNYINSYFDKIFIINLADKTERFKKISKQFQRIHLKYDRFQAVDGRCKKSSKECAKKRKEMKKSYDVDIKHGMMSAAAALTITTIEILRATVKNKWARVLIFEDDAVIQPKFMDNFKKGTKELSRVMPDWDVLYLGVGSAAGVHGVSEEKTPETKYLSSWAIAAPDLEYYVFHKDDLRIPCDEDECVPLSKHLTRVKTPGGTYSYAYSLKGARKMLKYIDNYVSDHIDKMIIYAIDEVGLKAVAFDVPIVMHEEGAIRADSDIPWN